MTSKTWLAGSLVVLLCWACLFTFLSGLGDTQPAMAQEAPDLSLVPSTGGPDAFGYTYDATAVFSWIDITGGTQIASADDQCRGPFPIGYTLYFYGVAHSQFWVSTNGLVLFGDTGSGGKQPNNTFIPSAGIPNNFAALFWDDLKYTPGSKLRYQTLGSTPNRYLVVEWHNVGHYSDPGHGMTFQAIFYEGSNDVKFQYLAMTRNLGGDGQSASIGIESADGRDGLPYSFNQSSVYDRLAISFLYPRSFPTPTPTGVLYTGGPDAFGYTWSRLVPCSWVDATGGVMVPWTTDVGRGPFDIGFRFNFYGTDYDQFYIGKGMVSFRRSYWAWWNEGIPSPGVPNGFAAPFWDDVWSAETSGHLYYKTFGTAPNRYLGVEWYEVGHYDDRNPAMTFEVIVYEGSNDIAFQYLSMNAHNRGDGSGATIGIENQDGRIGLQVSYNQSWVCDGAAVRFYYPSDAPRTPIPTPTRTATPRPGHHLLLPITVKRYHYYCDPYEPNDRLGQAYGPLASGVTYWARLCEGDADDYYYIDVSSLHPISIRLGHIPAGTDYDLFLYDRTGTKMKESRRRGSTDEHIDHTPARTGRYYIRVYPFSGRSNTDSYALSVQYD